LSLALDESPVLSLPGVFRIVLLKLSCAYKSPEVLIKNRFWFSISEEIPDFLHVYKFPGDASVVPPQTIF
jgi:hypothetical protein